ncbi:acyl carrier protein [Bacillus velezensis]|uniref:acyl carrier protein n=1 Tax=Bacillus velezensis TaxID=492670 RepID=UPI0015F6433F
MDKSHDGALKVQPDDIDLNVEFSEYGYDSISLTIFANMINQNIIFRLHQPHFRVSNTW